MTSQPRTIRDFKTKADCFQLINNNRDPVIKIFVSMVGVDECKVLHSVGMRLSNFMWTTVLPSGTTEAMMSLKLPDDCPHPHSDLTVTRFMSATQFLNKLSEIPLSNPLSNSSSNPLSNRETESKIESRESSIEISHLKHTGKKRKNNALLRRPRSRSPIKTRSSSKHSRSHTPN